MCKNAPETVLRIKSIFKNTYAKFKPKNRKAQTIIFSMVTHTEERR